MKQGWLGNRLGYSLAWRWRWGVTLPRDSWTGLGFIYLGPLTILWVP